MAKLLIREPKRGRRRASAPVSLEVERLANNEVVEVTNTANGEKLFELSIEPYSREVVLSVNTRAHVKVNDEGKQQMFAPRVDASTVAAAGKATWKVEDGKLKVWSSKGTVVELEIAPQPGPLTPTEEPHAVYGQQDVVFAIAMALKLGRHSLLSGPTGTAKTTLYRWFAYQLNWNFVLMPISRGTESAHLVGEYLPVDEAGKFMWTDMPVTEAVRASQSHPTLLVFDELNRIGNIAEFARIYSLLDDTKVLELKEKRANGGTAEMLHAGDLYVGATSNPSDDEAADYIGVTDLDPALSSRFGIQPLVGYPDPELEAMALRLRVKDLEEDDAKEMVAAATRIRQSEQVRFPISFRELEGWALALPYLGWKEAAEIAVVSKASRMYHADIRNLVKLQKGA